jgi:hypothetical protein
VIRPRGGTTRRRDDEEDDAATSSAEEIGRMLRVGREERGLDLLTVHDRLGRPITQIEALENGDLARLPDQAMALSTLRRYAALLGLDGDALALQMIDVWSARPAAARPDPGSEAGSASVATGVVTAVTSGPDHLRAFTQTGEVPKVRGGSSGPPSGSGASGYGMNTGPPTGTFPVVPRNDLKHSKRAVAKARRRLRAPASLKVITWIVAVLVVVVAAGFVVYQSKPQWLVQAHILKVSHPGRPTSGSTTPVQAAHPKNQVVATSTGATAATYAVAAKQFSVGVATSDRCWVEITSSNSSVPLVEGIQPGGKILTFPANGTMTVQVGSSAVVVAVSVGKKPVFLDTPHVTPFIYTFVPAS